MCGIAGWIGTIDDPEGTAARMATSLRHRGPDASGVRLWPKAGLVHTRLSIIDLSPTGAQPMAGEAGDVWVSFNGEIFNHAELRRDLQARGHRFRGRSDTEVIPALYREYFEREGLDFARRLRGQFAFAIYDERRQELILARDRFGIKPLYYVPMREALAFASEINSIRWLEGTNTDIDRQAVHDYVSLFYVPGPSTVFKGIRALEPGEALRIRMVDGAPDVSSRKYHAWSVTPDCDLTLDQSIERTEAMLAKAVANQLESDVPLGAFLSGGIDSSLICAFAQRALDRPLDTFNAQFSDPEYDETWAAKCAAERIGSRHTSLSVPDGEGTWENVTSLLAACGQPFADTSLFPTHAISELIRSHVTVALSGDGGDEAFGGYQTQQYLMDIVRWQGVPRPVRSLGMAAMGPLSHMGAIPESISRRIRDFDRSGDTEILTRLHTWIRDTEKSELCEPDGCLPVDRLFEPTWRYSMPRCAGRIERLSARLIETRVRLNLPSDYLFKVDMASMRSSLEVRVPFLDEELFEMGMSLPHRLRVDNKLPKRVLRAVAARNLPDRIANKPKQGFSVPVDRWVTEGFKSAMRETLLSADTPLAVHLKPGGYRRIVEAFCDGKPLPSMSRGGLYRRAIMLLSLHVTLSASRPAAATSRGRMVVGT